jgi:nicotinate-nucleotide adenylyltransferase
MEIKDLQKLIDNKFREYFGYSSLNERLKDIQDEFFELMKWRDVKNLKEETGDLLSSLIELCSESGWDAEELINDTLKKIEGRAEQYKTLGRKTKVAILGGAFDPIHNGHIKLAQLVLNTLGVFDEIWLMPAYNHLYNKDMVSPEHRLNMCKLSIKNDRRIKIFDYEIKNKLKGETYYFFKKLREEKELTEKYQFSMIIGLDNANTFDKWVNYQELEKMAQFVVVPRAGVQRKLDVNWYLQKPHIFMSNENSITEISSTMLRTLLNDSVDGKNRVNEAEILNYMDKNVYDYIIKNNLYLK